MDKLTQLPLPQTEDDNFSKNCDILLQVHSNVSKNILLFDSFCKVLDNMNYQTCLYLLKGLL